MYLSCLLVIILSGAWVAQWVM